MNIFLQDWPFVGVSTVLFVAGIKVRKTLHSTWRLLSCNEFLPDRTRHSS